MNESERYADPLEELYAIRRELSARYRHDVRLLAEAAREWKLADEANGVRYVTLPKVKSSTGVSPVPRWSE